MKHFDKNTPIHHMPHRNMDTEQEQNAMPLLKIVATTQQQPVFRLARFSKLRRLLRTACYVCRATAKMQGNATTRSRSSQIPSYKKREALRTIIKQEQGIWLSREMQALERGLTVPTNSVIAELSPFLHHGIVKI